LSQLDVVCGAEQSSQESIAIYIWVLLSLIITDVIAQETEQ